MDIDKDLCIGCMIALDSGLQLAMDRGHQSCRSHFMRLGLTFGGIVLPEPRFKSLSIVGAWRIGSGSQVTQRYAVPPHERQVWRGVMGLVCRSIVPTATGNLYTPPMHCHDEDVPLVEETVASVRPVNDGIHTMV